MLTCVDVGAGISRSPKGWNGIVPTLTPRMSLWLHQPNLKAANLGDRLLLGEEAMQLQGFPRSQLAAATSTSEAQLKDLAGNAFSAMPFVALYIAILAKMPAVTAAEGVDLKTVRQLGSYML